MFYSIPYFELIEGCRWFFFDKNKLCKNSEAQIVKKNKNELRTLSDLEVQNKNSKQQWFMFLLKTYSEKNNLNTIKVIFCNIIECTVEEYTS